MSLAPERQSYLENELKPVLDDIVLELMREMPDDPAAFMYQLLQDSDGAGAAAAKAPEAVSTATAVDESNGKRKGKLGGAPSGDKGKAGPPPSQGKGKGKVGPGGPPVGASSDSKGKGKGKLTAQGGFAPNMNKKIKPWPMAAMNILQFQASNGHLDNAAVAKGMLDLYMAAQFGQSCGDPNIDFQAKLDELGPLGGTALIFAALDGPRGAMVTSEHHVAVSVQAVGDGRGDADRVVEQSTNEAVEERRQKTVELCERFTKDHPPALGNSWLQVGVAYLESQPDGAELKAKAEVFVKEWFSTGVEAKTKAVSQEAVKKKEEEQRRRSELRKLEAAQVDLHWGSLCPRSIETVPWDTVRRARWCSGGMGGATLVQLGDSEAVVLKTLGLNAVAEVLAGEVSALVDVKVARSRPLATSDAEFKCIMQALEAVPTDGEAIAMLHQLGRAKFVVVMEYVAGGVLQGLEGNKTLQSDAASSVLSQLGGLIALDCILNNVDRVPAIWLNDGNFSNVMVMKDSSVIGIDQQVNAIRDPVGKERYLGSLREFIADTAKCNTSSASMKRVRTGLLENTGVELSDKQCRQIFDGASLVFRRMGESLSLCDSLAALSDQMRTAFSNTSVDVGLTQVDTMISFLIECVEVLKAAQ